MARILLIEDSPTQAQRLALVLEAAQFAVEIAPDAERGLERLAREHFDLVLSDLLLPGDSGFDVCRRIKADAGRRHIPVIVLTSQADPANVLRGLEARADGFLTKDREPEEIVRSIRRTLESAERRLADGPCRVAFLNQDYDITAGRQQLLNILVSAFEDVVRLNQRVEADAASMRELNRRLHAANDALADRNHRLQELADELAATAHSERRAHEELKKAQSQLMQSEKLASLGQLAAGLAHEVNNPLAYSINNLAVLQRDVRAALRLLALYGKGKTGLARVEPELAAETAAVEEEVDLPYLQENLERIIEQTAGGLGRVRAIIRNLRDFARLDEAQVKEINLNDALTATVEILHHELSRKDIRLRSYYQELPPLLCQPGKLNQAFLNILLNAIQACAAGGAIDVRTGVEPGTAVWVEIEDNGCGIAPEHLPRVFEPFFTTKPVGQGMGLGLSIAYGVIKDHRGSITADSTPGRGSIFRIRIPL
jgi:signal transduction histidine kinase